MKAIKNGNFITWPGIYSIDFKKILPTTIATEKGPLEQERKNFQSTKTTSLQNDDLDFFPAKENKTNEYIFKLINTNELKNKSYMDLCGRFPYTSSRGSKYILVVYDHDSNLIKGIPLKSRNAREIADQWEELNKKITKNAINTTFWILDNEASNLLKEALATHRQSHQLTPPPHPQNKCGRKSHLYV